MILKGIFGLIFLLFYIKETESIFCHQCINLECPGSEKECKSIREFVIQELKSQYFLGNKNKLPDCPGIDENVSSEWNHLIFSLEHCPAEKMGDSSCAVGRLMIQTLELEKPNATSFISEASIFGCVGMNFSKIINNYAEKDDCFSILKNGISQIGNVKYKHKIELSQCGKSDMCKNNDLCIAPKQSVISSFSVKYLKLERPKKTIAAGTLIMYIMIGVVILIVIAFFLGRLFFHCKNKKNSIIEENPLSEIKEEKLKDGHGRNINNRKILEENDKNSEEQKELKCKTDLEDPKNIKIETSIE